MIAVDSQISGFYNKSLEERLDAVRKFADLDKDEIGALQKYGALDFEKADNMVENVIGTMQFPMGIATYFLINGKDYLVPMAIEEPSVVAAASNGAKLARAGGGFKTESTPPIMIGQVQMTEIKDFEKAEADILGKKNVLVEMCNAQDSVLVKYGGGARDIKVRGFDKHGMLVVYVYVDVRDAMGANTVNTMAETIAPELEKITGGSAKLRIVSNLATERIVKAKAVWKKEDLEKSAGGDDSRNGRIENGRVKNGGVVDGIINAYEFAVVDMYRTATHNKGIMNGVDAVVIATGNDFRAVEAGAHSYAAISGKYLPLTKYYKNKDGDLVGELEMPMAVGLVGGATKTHPIAKISVKILGVKSASELGEVIAAVGLAQNFAALRALATEGIQRGHMRLHSKNIAVLAGAEGSEVEKVAKKMSEEKNVRVHRAKEILEELRK